jgi:hypothetical protein
MLIYFAVLKFLYQRITLFTLPHDDGQRQLNRVVWHTKLLVPLGCVFNEYTQANFIFSSSSRLALEPTQPFPIAFPAGKAAGKRS